MIDPTKIGWLQIPKQCQRHVVVPKWVTLWKELKCHHSQKAFEDFPIMSSGQQRCPVIFFLWTPSKERTQQHFIAFLCWLGFVYIKGFTDTPSAPRPGDNEPFEVKVQAAVEFKTWGHVVFVGVQNKLSDKIVLQLMHGWNSWNAESLHSCLHIFYI